MSNRHHMDTELGQPGSVGEHIITKVVIIDDAYDPFDVNEPSEEDIAGLWSTIEFDKTGARGEVSQVLGRTLTQAGDLSGGLIDALLEGGDQFPNFANIWAASDLGRNAFFALSQINKLADWIYERTGETPLKMGSEWDGAEVTDHAPQVVFLDWQLGIFEPKQAVASAVEKAKTILSACESAGVQKPLIVLISTNRPSDDAISDFCHKSGLIRGMFYALNKNILIDPLRFPLYMHLFESSLPIGRKMQSFMDRLHDSFESLSQTFLQDISDLTLADYAFVQSMSLRDDSQPLGDYLVWLFSTHLGQLLLTEPLQEMRADLDAMLWHGTLPSLTPPSERFNELYRNALYDMSVEPVSRHPLAGQKDIPCSIVGPLGLGDIYRRNTNADADTENASQCLAHETKEQSLPIPEVMILISPQCDLECRPENINRKLVLIGGTLIPFEDRMKHKDATITDLFVDYDNHRSILWDLKSAETVVYREFDAWLRRQGFQREARLRLPFALEVQRAFAADFTRIGSRIAPPIYQPLLVELLRVNKEHSAYEPVASFDNGKGAFLMLTKGGQQCVLTTELLTALQSILSDELTSMRERGEQPDAPQHLPQQIAALARVLNDQSKWSELQSPFDLPQIDNLTNVIDGWVRVAHGDARVSSPGHKPVAVVRIDQNDADTV